MTEAAKAKGAAHDATVKTEANLQATPDTVLHADIDAEAAVRLEKTRGKAEKLAEQLKDAREEVARLEQESR